MSCHTTVGRLVAAKSSRVAVLVCCWGIAFVAATATCAADEPTIVNLWPGKPPGDTAVLPPEADQTKPNDRGVAGKGVVRLGNVSTPQLVVYRPDPKIDTGAAVVICPGGGHHILAWDLEGTEVAEWLNTLGSRGLS